MIVVAWAAGVMAVEAARARGGEAPITCSMRRVTGVPCGTCGSTRAAFALTRGDAVSALRYNPFVVVGGVALAGVGLLRVGFGRRIELGLGTTATRAAWCALGAAFALNWAYIIAYHHGVVAGPETVRTATAQAPSTPPQPP